MGTTGQGKHRMTRSPEIWDNIYQNGNFMQYPSEYFVKLLKNTEIKTRLSGVTLDHGCGSGINAECLIRAGHKVVCSEVSQSALDITRRRLIIAGELDPSCYLVDPARPLAPQLPEYDNVICWLSLCYASATEMATTISQLINGMSLNSLFWFATPTKNDLLYRLSIPSSGPSRVLGPAAGAQEGAVMTIFNNQAEVESMFLGTEILGSGIYGMTFDGIQHEYLVINAKKIV